MQSITSYNTNDYWELTRHEAGLPWESTLYVPKILAAAIVGHNLAAFGFADVTPDPPFAYEQVDVPAGTALATVARAAGTKPEVIEALNPDLIAEPDAARSRRGHGAPAPGHGVAYAASFDKTRDGDKVETVVLRFGETLDDVARARGTTAQAAAAAERRQGQRRAARRHRHRRPATRDRKERRHRGPEGRRHREGRRTRESGRRRTQR